MKTTFLVITLIGCVALGILCFEQSKNLQSQRDELAKTKQQVESLQAELQEKTDAIENARLAEAKAKILQKTLNESTSVVAAESKKTEQLKQSLDQAKTNNPMHTMAEMFKDPQMREMMKAQQKAAIGPILDRQYADLFKQLNLTPDQAAQAKDLIEKKMLVGADVGMSMLDSSLDASQRADLTKQIKTETDDYDQQMKQLVGDNNYDSFKSYEKTIPDRMAVDQFNSQNSGTARALTPAQQQQLIQALSDSRNNFTWTSGLNQQDAGMNGDLASLLTEDNIAKFTAEREQFDQQFLTRAQQFLTPEQVTAYGQFQHQQLQMQLMGFKMAGQMMK
jgi:Spy/CpxP family protein refolding chaperone